MCHSIAAPGDSGLTGCQQLAPDPTTDRTSDLSHLPLPNNMPDPTSDPIPNPTHGLILNPTSDPIPS